MKLKYLLFIALTTLFLFSCNSKNNPTYLKHLFKRWKVDYIELNGKKIKNLYGENQDFDYEFKNNNSYLIYSPNNDFAEGKWEINSDENCIYIRNEKNEIYGKVILISKDNFTLIPTTKIGKLKKSDQLVKYYYIPK